jgi:hypothetical protein
VLGERRSAGARKKEMPLDSKGNLYGGTIQGGNAGDGMFYELSPSGSGGAEAVIYNYDFNGLHSQSSKKAKRWAQAYDIAGIFLHPLEKIPASLRGGFLP